MLNEELSKEVLSTAVREAESKVVKPVCNFVWETFGKPTEEKMVNALKLAVTAPGRAVKNKLHPEHGEMKVKDLIRKDQGAQSLDIDGEGLQNFRKIANKYGVDFAIVKSTDMEPPKYSVFFKARDADAIQSVVNEYAAKQLNLEKEKRPSILAKLSKFKELVASLPKKALEKRKEQER